jgi:uncharacterized protein YndB with AHSA1/START domain
MAGKNKPNELYISRIYDAPVKMVWDAWTDPKQVAQWWGPRGFTLTTLSHDKRTGGSWSYIMHGPDGTDYNNKAIYHEVEKYKRMVYDHGGNDDRPPLFRVTVEFSETAGKTKMEMTMALATPEAAQEIKKFIKKAGGDSTWDRLAEYLSSEDRFVINRSFDAPINLMFDLWTDPKHFSQWLPPTGATMKFIKADIKVGGTSFYEMDAAGGVKMYGKVHYKEITKPNRLVYTQIFCDKDGNISRHPMAPTWPETMLTTVTLTEEGPEKTRVTVDWQVYGEATTAERETFHNAKAGMAQGWGGSFDKLENYISEKKNS